MTFRQPGVAVLPLAAELLSWIASPQPRTDPKFRLFCLPFAGGGGAPYRSWASLVPVDVEVCLAQLPGREGRLPEEPYRDLLSLVRDLATAIEPAMDGVVTAFFGHSMGALVSFELARELRRRGASMPATLFLSAFPAPHLSSQRRPVHAMDNAGIIQELRRLSGTADEILAHAELMELLLPTIRADFQLCETYAYRPEPPLPVAITCFGGQDDEICDRSRLEGWKSHSTKEFQLRILPGDHFFFLEEAALMLRVMLKDMKRAAGC